MLRRLVTFLVTLLIVLAAPAAQAQLLPVAYDRFDAGSWDQVWWTNGWAFDEIQLHYRADLDQGGGDFRSPYATPRGVRALADRPAFTADPSWTGAGSTSDRIVLRGDRIDGLGMPRFELDFVMHFSGDMTQGTGFEWYFYDGGTRVAGWDVTYDGTSFSFTANSTDPGSVPEPGSMALLGLGLAGVIVVRRRKTQ